MEKEKIIEEMAEEINMAFEDVQSNCDCGDCIDCEYYHIEGRIGCKSYGMAKNLYNAGYRKVDNGCTIKMQGESELQKVFDELLEGNTYVTIKEKEVEIEQAKQEVASMIIEHFDNKKNELRKFKYHQDQDDFWLQTLEFWDYIDNFVGLTGEEILAEIEKKYKGE